MLFKGRFHNFRQSIFNKILYLFSFIVKNSINPKNPNPKPQTEKALLEDFEIFQIPFETSFTPPRLNYFNFTSNFSLLHFPILGFLIFSLLKPYS